MGLQLLQGHNDCMVSSAQGGNTPEGAGWGMILIPRDNTTT